MSTPEEGVECNVCSARRIVTKSAAIDSPPCCLILNVKRFVETEADKIIKNCASVTLESEIDIGKYLVPLRANKRRLFERSGGQFRVDGAPIIRLQLASFTVHLGVSRDHGHHIAYAKEVLKDSSSWYCFNDDSVSQVADDVALRETQAQLITYVSSEPNIIAALRGDAVSESLVGNSPSTRLVRLTDDNITRVSGSVRAERISNAAGSSIMRVSNAVISDTDGTERNSQQLVFDDRLMVLIADRLDFRGSFRRRSAMKKSRREPQSVAWTDLLQQLDDDPAWPDSVGNNNFSTSVNEFFLHRQLGIPGLPLLQMQRLANMGFITTSGKSCKEIRIRISLCAFTVTSSQCVMVRCAEHF